MVLDIIDPRTPTVVSRSTGDSTFTHHWGARDPGSDRAVFASDADEDIRVLLARFDSGTGSLTWDETFRDPATGRLGVSFKRAKWPNGASGQRCHTEYCSAENACLGLL